MNSHFFLKITILSFKILGSHKSIDADGLSIHVEMSILKNGIYLQMGVIDITIGLYA